MDEKQFCEFISEFYGEKIDKPEQLFLTSVDGNDLLELINKAITKIKTT